MGVGQMAQLTSELEALKEQVGSGGKGGGKGVWGVYREQHEEKGISLRWRVRINRWQRGQGGASREVKGAGGGGGP